MALKRELDNRKENLKILELEPGATKDEIRKAYTRLALKSHPDKNPDDPHATEKFQKLSKAYDDLSRPVDLRGKWCPVHGYHADWETVPSDEEYSDEEDWYEEDEVLYLYKRMFLALFSKIIFSRKFKSKKKRSAPTAEEMEEELDFEFLNEKYKEEESEDEFVLTEEDLKKFHSYEAWESEQNANRKKRRKRGRRKKAERVPQTEQPTLSKKRLHAEHRRREQEMKKIGEELSKKIKTESSTDRAPSPSPQQRKNSKEVEMDIMENIKRQQEENRKRDEALQEKLRELDGQEKSQNKKLKRLEKKAQRKQQKLEKLKPTEPQDQMEVEENNSVKIHKGIGLELPMRDEVKRPKVTRNHTVKSSVLQSYFKEPAVETGAPERPEPVSVVSDPGPSSAKRKGDPALLEKHLKMYNDLMKEQPQRHTEQQLRLEREAERRQLQQKQQQELNQLRNQYKTQAMTFTFHDKNNNNGADSSQDTGGKQSREYYLQKHKEMERRRNAEEDEMNHKMKKSVPDTKKKPATKWYQMDLSKPEPSYQEPLNIYEPIMPAVSANIWQKRAVEQERKYNELSELLPESEEEETRMLRLALRASMETAEKEKQINRYEEKLPYRPDLRSMQAGEDSIPTKDYIVTQNWDRSQCDSGNSIWEANSAPKPQVSNPPDLHSAVLARQQFWENQQKLSNVPGDQNRLEKRPTLDSLCSFQTDEDWKLQTDEDWKEVPNKNSKELKREKGFINAKGKTNTNTFGIQQNVENRFNVLENQQQKSKTKTNAQNTNEGKEKLITKKTSAQSATKSVIGKKSKVSVDKKSLQVDRNKVSVKTEPVDTSEGSVHWWSSGATDDWEEPVILPPTHIVEHIGDIQFGNVGVEEDWDLPKPSKSNVPKKDNTAENDNTLKQTDLETKSVKLPISSSENKVSNNDLDDFNHKQCISGTRVSVESNKLLVKHNEPISVISDNSKIQNEPLDTKLSEVKTNERQRKTRFEATDKFENSLVKDNVLPTPGANDTSSQPKDPTTFKNTSTKLSSPAVEVSSTKPNDPSVFRNASSQQNHSMLENASTQQSYPYKLENVSTQHNSPTALSSSTTQKNSSAFKDTSSQQNAPSAFANASTQQSNSSAFGNAPTQQSNSSAFGNALTQQSNPPAFGNASSQQSNSSAFGNAPTQQSNPPEFGNAPTQQNNQSAFGTAPTQQSNPPAAPTQQSNPPAFGTAPTQQSNPPAFGTAPTQQSNPPAFGNAPTQQSNPPAFGNASSQQSNSSAFGTAPTQQSNPSVFGNASSTPAGVTLSSRPGDSASCEDRSPATAAVGTTQAAGVGQPGSGGGLPYGLPVHLRQAYLQYLQQTSPPTPGTAATPTPSLPMYDPVLNPFGLTSVAMMILQQQLGSYYQNLASQQILAANLIPGHFKPQQQADQQQAAQDNHQNKSSNPIEKEASHTQNDIAMQNIPELHHEPTVQHKQEEQSVTSGEETKDEEDFIRLPKVPSLSSRLSSNNPLVQSVKPALENHRPASLVKSNTDDDIDKDGFDEEPVQHSNIEESCPPPRPPYSADLRGKVYIPPHRREPDPWKPDTNRHTETNKRSEQPVQHVEQATHVNQISVPNVQMKKTWDSQNCESQDSTSGRSNRKNWRKPNDGQPETVNTNTSTTSDWNQTSSRNLTSRGGFGTPNVQKAQQSNTLMESVAAKGLLVSNTVESNSQQTSVDYRTVPARRGGFGIPGRRNKVVAKREVTFDEAKSSAMYENFSVTSHGDHRSRGGFGAPGQSVDTSSSYTTQKGDASWPQNRTHTNITVPHRGGFGTPNRNLSATPGINHVTQTHSNIPNNSGINSPRSNTWSMLHTNSTSNGLNVRFSGLPAQPMENSNSGSTSHAHTLKARKERSHAILEMLKGMRVNDNEDLSQDNMAEMEQRDY